MLFSSRDVSGSFQKRRIDVTFTLGSGGGSFADGNTAKLTGLRVNARIRNSGAPQIMAEAIIRGMTPDMMNRLSTLGQRFIVGSARNNTIKIEAGDSANGMSVVYEGIIYQAWIDFSSAPDVAFRVTSYSGRLAALKPVDPTSFKGAADVVDIMTKIAGLMDLKLENHNVTGKLSNPYFPGTALEQMRACAEAGDFNAQPDYPRKALVIWPKRGFVDAPIIDLSPTTGLIGYPTYTANGIACRALFTPALRYFGRVKITTADVPQANGTWVVFNLEYILDAEIPGGNWMMQFEGFPPGVIKV